MKRSVMALLDMIARARWIGNSRVSAGRASAVAWRRIRVGTGSVRIGNESIVYARIDMDGPAGRVSIGDRAFVGNSHIVCHTAVDIGDDVIISWGVTIVDHDSHSLDAHKRCDDVAAWRMGRKSWDDVGIGAVKIADRVWIGFGASVLKGVTIGKGAVIGARSVVTSDVQPFTLVVGNPARVVRQLSDAR